MSNIKKILVPFDFSEAAINALEYALTLVGFNRPIDIIALQVGVLPANDSKKKEVQENFEKLLIRLNRKTVRKPKIVTVSGHLLETILKTQIEQQIDMVVMGTMGDKNAEEALTNTSKLVLEANCPVIVVPYGSSIGEPRQIALVLGKNEIEDKNTLRVLLDISRMYDARVHVLTIFKESITSENMDVEKNEQLLEYYLEHFYAEHSFSKSEDLEEGILSYVNDKNIDMLAILPRNHVRNTKPSEGRLTKLLALHSSIPLLTLD